MANDDLIDALKASNKSNTEQMRELRANMEAAEAREVLAEMYPDAEPEEFEGLNGEIAVKLARSLAGGGARTNTYDKTKELQGRPRVNLVSGGRDEWEARKNDD